MTPRSPSSAPPHYLTPLLGRDAELAWLAERFVDSDRLVTVFGPPGVGKTRLVVEAIAVARSAGSDAVFCDLMEAQTPEDVAVRVLTALGGGRAAAAVDPAEVVARRLTEGGPTLLVLDNFEHLVKHTARVVADWSAAARGSTIVVTSREVLRVSGERALDLRPLAVPTSSADLETSDAGRLLLDTIARYRSGELGLDEREALVAVLERLDGLPLAIELIAPRLALLGARAVLDRLGEVLAESGARSAHVQTLHRAIAWSWELLDEAEQRALVTCTRFRGGFSLAAFEASVGALGERPAVGVLAALRDKSLVRPLEGRDRRFGVYAAIAEFVDRHADHEQIRAADLRHREHFASLARSLVGRDDAEALRSISADRANLAIAVERALGDADGEGALTILSVLGQLADGDVPGARRVLFERAAPYLDDRVVSGWALHAEAQLCHSIGRYDAEQELAERARAIADKHGDLRLAARAHYRIGLSALYFASRTDAQQAFREAIDLADRARDHATAASAFTCVAFYCREHGSSVDALAHATSAVTRAESARAPIVAATAHCQRALAHVALRDLVAAEVDARIGSELAVEDGGAHVIAYTRAVRGFVEYALGRFEVAEHLLREAIATQTQLALSLDERYTRALLAVLLIEANRDDEALREIRRADAVVGPDALRGWRTFARVIVEGTIAARRRSAPFDLEATFASEACASPAYARARAIVRALVGSVHDRGVAVAAAPVLAEPGTSEPAEALFAAMLARRIAKSGAPTARPPAPADELLVHRGGHWFQLPDAERVSCRGRGAIRLLVVALANARLATPGQPLDNDAIRDAGWPGEKMSPVSARNRIKQSMAVLRKLGLGAWLEWREGGYLLSPGLPVRLVD